MQQAMRCVLMASLVLVAGCANKQVVGEPLTDRAFAPIVQPDSPPRDAEAMHAPNPLHRTRDEPLSTFSVDVDTGSYSRARRSLRDGKRPDPGLVRTEEFLNYFDFGYVAPTASDTVPFSITTELAVAPWNPRRHLLLVGLKGREVAKADLPPASLVFLIDTSGSMAEPDKLPLLVQAFRDLSSQLRAQDRVAIVTYASSGGLALPTTAGDRRAAIVDALENLSAGGSTAGGEGIVLAYATARAQFILGGINRVILATDGDFNVGTTSLVELKALVAKERDAGIALTTIGFGASGYRDAVAEQLADVGNGNHAFVDDAFEAKKGLQRELGSTLLTIAKDVKVQLQFNPEIVAEYRLLGYENRLLTTEQFRDDAVDAGEIGAGHDVTALYEIALVGSGGERLPAADATPAAVPAVLGGDEIARLRLRYKAPDGHIASELSQSVVRADLASTASARLRFAAAVAGFAETLRDNSALGDFGLAALADLATGANLPDPHGERAELADLITLAETLPARTDGALPD